MILTKSVSAIVRSTEQIGVNVGAGKEMTGSGKNVGKICSS